MDIATGKVEKHPFMTMMRDVAIAKNKEMGEKAITKLQVCLLRSSSLLHSFLPSSACVSQL